MKTRSLPIFLLVLRRAAGLHGMRSFVLNQGASEQGPPHQAQPLRKPGPIREYSVCRLYLAAAKVTCWMGPVVALEEPTRPTAVKVSVILARWWALEKAKEALVGPLVHP